VKTVVGVKRGISPATFLILSMKAGDDTRFFLSKENNMNQLPFELRFMHKFNLHKTGGLLIDDDDLRSMARVYGVKVKDLQKLEKTFNRSIEDAANDLRKRCGRKTIDTPYTVAAIGDSITSDRESYAKILNRLWQDDPMRSVIDCGISGDTSADVIRRFFPTVLEQDFDRAVVFIGTNDSRANDDEFGHVYVSLEEYRSNVSYIVESLQKRRKEIVLVTVPYADNKRLRSYFSDMHWKYDYGQIDRTNEVLRELSKEYGTGLCEFAGKMADIGGDCLEQDGLHISVKGHKILCRLLLDILP
jgi:lysophospholipase L1-like esterase